MPVIVFTAVPLIADISVASPTSPIGFFITFIAVNAAVNNVNEVSKVARNCTSAGPKFRDEKFREVSPPPCKPVMAYFFSIAQVAGGIERDLVERRGAIKDELRAKVVRPNGPMAMVPTALGKSTINNALSHALRFSLVFFS